MSTNKYVVLPASDFSAAIQAKLKNYGQNQDHLFIEDTPETVSATSRIRIDNGQTYFIMKVSQNTPTAKVRELLPGHGEGGDKFKQIYNGNKVFIDFLNENFE